MNEKQKLAESATGFALLVDVSTVVYPAVAFAVGAPGSGGSPCEAEMTQTHRFPDARLISIDATESYLLVENDDPDPLAVYAAGIVRGWWRLQREPTVLSGLAGKVE